MLGTIQDLNYKVEQMIRKIIREATLREKHSDILLSGLKILSDQDKIIKELKQGAAW
jgi:hypothetical protein